MRLYQPTALLLLILSLVLAACTQPLPVAPQTPAAETPAATAESPATPSEEAEPTPSPAPESGGADNLDQEELVGTEWVLESYGTPGAETPVAGETLLTIEFAADGQLSGNAGCNTFAGSYQIQEDELVLGEIVSTLVACADSALMEQEVQYLDALQNVSGYRIEGDRLTIVYDEGQGVLNFVRTASTPAEPESTETATPAPEAGTTGNDSQDSALQDGASQDGASQDDVSQGGESQDFIWNCYTCFGNQVWNFEDGEVSRIELPVEIEYFFGYAPATERILYSTPLPLLGAGPSQITVHDLWLYDVASGQAEPIFSEQNIVEAVWGPDGEQLAYIRATDTTYELRWHGLDGEDKLLASDVAFTFSVSPQGDKVAFTRESGYGLPGEPGFYVVDVATGDEWLVADVDRAGSGSIDDKPVWSPSGQHVILPTYGTPDRQGLVRAAVDGSGSVSIAFDAALAEEEWYGAEPFAPFWAGDRQLIGHASWGGANAQLGGPATIVLYQLNEVLDTIIDGEAIMEGTLIGWDVPGSSIWIQSVDGSIQSVPLPAL